MRYIDMSNWYDKYTGIPYKHLGNDFNGIDCYNLCRLVLERECNLNIPETSDAFCNIVDDDWYNKMSVSPFELRIQQQLEIGACKKVHMPSKFDIIIMSIGATNITNHCAVYIGSNKILHTMIDRPSWVSSYGTYYKQYTTGIYRWINLNN